MEDLSLSDLDSELFNFPGASEETCAFQLLDDDPWPESELRCVLRSSCEEVSPWHIVQCSHSEAVLPGRPVLAGADLAPGANVQADAPTCTQLFDRTGEYTVGVAASAERDACTSPALLRRRERNRRAQVCPVLCC